MQIQPNKKSSPSTQKYTVSVRIRPKINQTQQTVFIPSKSKYVKQLKQKSIVTYSFDNVFEQAYDNQHIFDKSIKEKIELFLRNKINTTILAYGQTGSGKTHTLFGHKSPNQKGLTHYIIEHVMNFCQQKKIRPTCTFLQIYKQKVTDLLNGNQVLLRDNSKGELTLDGNKTQTIQSKQQLIQLFAQANKNKIFGNSYIHSQSSRSHVLFNIEVQNTSLNILDLCGSQVLTYKFDQKQRQQTNAINLSLFTLNSVISDLCQKNDSKFIPFRNSVLTRLLKKSLIDQKKVQIYLFCNISPQKQHQQFSSGTLRFGQLAIQIDQKDNIKQQKINLSQQKRQSKKVSNIIEIQAKQTNKFYDLPEPWQRYKCQISNKKTVIYKLEKTNAKMNILLLHAYGGGCDGTDWNNFASYLINYLNCNLYSVDFPGFGKSQGQKFTSRSEKFHQKNQPLEFMSDLFKQLKFSKNNQVFLLGYDLGGAIALRTAMENKIAKAVSGIIAFHPTWTDKIEKLAIIQCPTLLLWFPVQTFHLISAGQKISKIIKNSLLYKFNIGPYTNQKAGGYYDRYHSEICQKIIQFILNQRKNQKSQKQSQNQFKKIRGKIVEQKIQINVDKEQEKLNEIRNSLSEYYKLLQNKQQNIIFDSLIKGGVDKPKFIKLASNLPVLSPQTINWIHLKNWNAISNTAKNILNFDQIPFLTPGRQIHIKSKVNMSVLKGQRQYLAYDHKNGEQGITHKAFISQKLDQTEILETGKVPVEVQSILQGKQNNGKQLIKVELDNILSLNSATRFKKNVLGHFVFQDNVTCKYDSLIVRLMLFKSCYLLKQVVQKMDFSQNDEKLLDLQKQATQIIFKTMDLRHLVHQGIDNTRYTGTDVGRLAYYGQGNCHHLASVLAALLLPFGKILGWDVIFRAGSFFIGGRQIDDKGNPLPNWNGKPNANVEDHTWLQIVYKPSNKILFFDPSFSLCNLPLDSVYSLKGKMHISGKPLNFAHQDIAPQKIC